MVQLDNCRRNSYIKLKFSGECKDPAQLSYVGDLEKLGIGYSNGIDEDPDTIMLSIVNYIQLRELLPKYKLAVLNSPALTVDISYCKIDLVNYVEIPFRLSCSLKDYFADENFIEISQSIKLVTEDNEAKAVKVTFRVYLWGACTGRYIIKYYEDEFRKPELIKVYDNLRRFSMRVTFEKVYRDLLNLDILGEEWK